MGVERGGRVKNSLTLRSAVISLQPGAPKDLQPLRAVFLNVPILIEMAINPI